MRVPNVGNARRICVASGLRPWIQPFRLYDAVLTQFVKTERLCCCGRVQRKQNVQIRNFGTPPPIIRIGNVERRVSDPSQLTVEQRRKIPRGYLASFMNDPVAQAHLQWLIQKDLLQQDCILVGMTGGDTIRCRRLAMAYAELTQQPVEILTISRDTTESDLKQRRALHYESNKKQDGSNASQKSRIIFQNQAPVRAAIQGHLLILDGLQRAERNVLPTLNNLLENREMPLEDGRLLVSAQRYKFLQHQQGDNPIGQFLIPVHHNFKVLAILSHDPNQPQRRLDPPVRSRFQIRRIDPVPTDVLYDQLLVAEEEWLATTTTSNSIAEHDTSPPQQYVSTVASAKQLALLATAMTTNTTTTNATRSSSSSSSKESTTVGRVSFPLNAVSFVQRVRNRFPHQPVMDLIERIYPYGTSESRLRMALKKWPMATTSRDAIRRVYREMKLLPSTDETTPVYEFHSSEIISDDPNRIQLKFKCKHLNKEESTIVNIEASSGGHLVSNDTKSTFVKTTGSQQVLTAMLQEHAVGRDILLVSPKGEGKSAIVKYFCSITGYRVHTFPLYREMTATDLFVRRGSSAHHDGSHENDFKSNDYWSESPLLIAARTGQLCVLDGIEKLSSDCLATLQGFLSDREVSLPDGTKYVQPSSPEDIPTKVKDSFRVIALASIAAFESTSAAPTWMSGDVTSMFSTIAIPTPSRQCIQQILQPFNKLSDSDLDKLLNCHERLLVSAGDCGVSPMSIRTMKRIIKNGRLVAGAGLYEPLCSSLLIDLLQPTKRAALESLIRSCRIHPIRATPSKKKIRVDFDDDSSSFKIGSLVVTPLVAQQLQLVPSPVFWDIPSHMRIIQSLLSEWAVGERSFLLLGNQGTGKNKICDRLCQLLNHEREYMQLHRDTTIGQLTVSPSLENGQIVWNDSPLVRAVVHGRALVIDEADKAPLEVVAVLKSLVEDGELLLADGRRIVRTDDDGNNNNGKGMLVYNFTYHFSSHYH
jgi:von Willebrand factor A domain-containing protein 8